MHDQGGNTAAAAALATAERAELDQEISTIGTYLEICGSRGVSDNNPSIAKYRKRLAELQKLRATPSRG